MTAEIRIATAVQDRAATDPDRIAMRDGSKEITYRTFALAIDRVALALAAEGIAPSSRVGIEAPVFYAHWVAIMALHRLGAITSSLPETGGAERARMASLDAVLSMDATSGLRTAVPKFIHYEDDWINRTAAAADERGVALPDPIRAGETIGRITFSSGTTGVAKAIFQPASQIRYKARDHAELVDENTRYLCGYGIETTPGREIGTWFKGGTAILPYRRTSRDPGRAGAIEQATLIVTSPASLVAILASKGGEFAGRAGRLVRIGGAPLPIALRDDALKRFCARMDLAYGSMEAGTMAGGDAALLDRHPGAVGYPPEGVEIEIVDKSGRVVPPGREGLLRLRSPHMATGYIGDPETTAKFFRDGWFYPGDVGLMEEDGLVVILGRDNEVTNVGGAKFAPDALEHQMRAIPGLKDACVLAVPNRSGVHVPVVLGVGEDGANPDALEAEIGRVLHAARLPVPIIRWTGEIPRAGRGKPLRQKLAQEMKEKLWG